ncbi:MAG: DUF4838 domain-containing protein, partial [Planctomycetes bacterium]|nr:DUF4838 domain-containing protein [Planctomycetota bacterium]
MDWRPVLVLSVLAVALRAYAEEAALTLVAEGQPKAVVVVAAAPSTAATEGAKILVEHLVQMSGARLETLKDGQLGEVTVKEGRIASPVTKLADMAFVLVGESALTEKLGVTAKGLGPGGILVRTMPNALVLLGPDAQTPSDPNGTRYAITTFLHDQLDCRYLWPGELGKVVPQRRTISVPKLDVQLTPLLRQRNIRSLHYHDRLQQGLDRLKFTKDDFLRVRAAAEATQAASNTWFGWHRMGGTLNLVPGHAFGHVWAKYSQDHPEWFAMQPNGSRDQTKLSPTRSRLCKSNRELIAAIAQEKIEQLNKGTGPMSVSVGPNDGGHATFCVCHDCKKLDPPEARKITLWDLTSVPRRDFEYVSLTDRTVFFWNGIAERVTKAHPNALLVADAYSAYSAPPVRAKLHPNLVIRFAPISYSSDKARQQGRADWDAWSAAAPKIYFRPNLLLLGRREGTLAIYVHKLAEDFRYLAHHSMMGTDFDSCCHNWATQGLNYYVLARLHWNPDQKADDLIDDYCRSGFGRAAAEVKRYLTRVEQLTDEMAAKELEVTQPYTPAVVGELRGILDAADKAAGDEI